VSSYVYALFLNEVIKKPNNYLSSQDFLKDIVYAISIQILRYFRSSKTMHKNDYSPNFIYDVQ
jgi:hypothetical protein